MRCKLEYLGQSGIHKKLWMDRRTDRVITIEEGSYNLVAIKFRAFLRPNFPKCTILLEHGVFTIPQVTQNVHVNIGRDSIWILKMTQVVKWENLEKSLHYIEECGCAYQHATL